jgi:GTP-binding protein Era
VSEIDARPATAALSGAEMIPEGFRCGFVALVGRANVGKSTLMNRLVGAKLSIVSEVPQTTRFPVRGILHRPGLQVVFIDTPGIHKPRYRMNEEMVRLSTRVLREVDLVAALVDASEGFGPGDRFVFDLLGQARSRNLLVLNKVDLTAKENLLPLMDEAGRAGLFDDIVPVSALTGENSDRLEAVIAAKMPPGPPHFPEDMLTDLPQRQAIAELIREQVFRQTRQEVPHATAVVIELVEPAETGLTRIHATIVTDKESQKGILIGEGGRMMKGIGTSARHALEGYLGTRVHLSLWVKVKKGWRDDTSLLRLIGLPLS